MSDKEPLEVPPEEDDQIQFEPVEEAEDDDSPEKGLDNMMAELRGVSSASCNAYKKSTHGGKLQFLFAFLPDESSLGQIMERIRDEYGGGDYRIQARSEGKLIINRSISIAEPIKPLKQDTGNTQSNNFQMLREDFSKLIESQNAQMKEFMAMIIQSNTNSTPSPVNSAEMQTSFLDTMIKMKEFFGTPEAKTNSIELVMEGVKLAKELNVGSGEANTMDVILKAIDTFGAPIAKMTEKMNERPATVKEIKSITNRNPTQEDRALNILKGQLTFLVSQAKGDKDPSLYADLILDNLPTEKIQEFILDPQAIEKMGSVNPEVLVYRKWFEALGKEINVALTGEDEEKEVEPINDLTSESKSDLVVETISKDDNAHIEPIITDISDSKSP